MPILLALGISPSASAPAAPTPTAAVPDIRQFKHTRWTVEDGAPANIVAMTQSADGFLWLATGYGLYRFDGVTFERIPPPADDTAKGDQVNALLATTSGDLWIGYRKGGIAIYRNGELRSVFTPQGDDTVTNIVQTPDGAIWTAAYHNSGRLARYFAGNWQLVDASWNGPDRVISSLVVDKSGTLWTAGWSGISMLPKGAHRFITVLKDDEPENRAMRVDARNRVWLIDGSGLSIIGEGGKAVPPRHAANDVQVFDTHLLPRLLIDEGGNAWASDQVTGLVFMTPGSNGLPGTSPTDRRTYAILDGLSSNTVTSLFQGREGEVWVGTASGLDRFRPASVIRDIATIGIHAGSPFADRRGNVYIIDQGLRRLYPDPAVLTGPLKDVGTVCDGADGSLWMIADRVTFRWASQKLTSVPRTADLNFPLYGCAVDTDGSLWVAGGSRGMYRVRGQKWTKFAPRAGDEASGGFEGARLDSEARVLTLMRPAGLARIAQDRVDVIWDGSPIGGITTFGGNGNFVVMGGPKGLGVFDGKKTRSLSSAAYPWLANIKSVARAGSDTWVLTSRGLVQVDNAALASALDKPGSPLSHRVFDLRDGLPAQMVVGSGRDLATDAQGRAWVMTPDGLASVDPKNIIRNTVAPPVVITALNANDTIARDPKSVDLPAGTANLEIDYAALSLTIPERVQFRYRLDGVDKDWIDPGSRRQAFYTRLGPGRYRFQVIASNNDGVWNRTGATLEFSIAPTFIQSIWFALLCVVIAVLGLWFLYTLRVRQLTAGVRGRLEAQQAERERIARDLHDTLLQGFQGLVLRFQAATERIPVGLPARPILEQALDRADLVLIEGRDRVRALRRYQTHTLDQMLIDLADELAERSEAAFKLTIEGAPREISPLVLDEVALIGQEAIRNAFCHAGASAIDVLIIFHRNELRLTVSDNGCGIRDDIATAGGRDGHYGLIGMRERAAQIGGRFDITSRTGAGTDVTLVVPGARVYASKAGHRLWPKARRRALGETE